MQFSQVINSSIPCWYSYNRNNSGVNNILQCTEFHQIFIYDNWCWMKILYLIHSLREKRKLEIWNDSFTNFSIKTYLVVNIPIRKKIYKLTSSPAWGTETEQGCIIHITNVQKTIVPAMHMLIMMIYTA